MFLFQYNNDTFLTGGKDIQAIFGWVDDTKPATRRSGNTVLQIFQKYAGMDELPMYHATLMTQDPHSLREGLPKCVFWESAGFSKYAWID